MTQINVNIFFIGGAETVISSRAEMEFFEHRESKCNENNYYKIILNYNYNTAKLKMQNFATSVIASYFNLFYTLAKAFVNFYSSNTYQ